MTPTDSTPFENGIIYTTDPLSRSPQEEIMGKFDYTVVTTKNVDEAVAAIEAKSKEKGVLGTPHP
jgi:hypothetical protein